MPGPSGLARRREVHCQVRINRGTVPRLPLRRTVGHGVLGVGSKGRNRYAVAPGSPVWKPVDWTIHQNRYMQVYVYLYTWQYRHLPGISSCPIYTFPATANIVKIHKDL